MSVDLTSGPPSGGRPLSDEDVIVLARDAIEASREEILRGRDGGDTAELQQPGVTVDLGHRNIVRLPDEVIDIIKDEIERLAISHNRVSSFPTRLSECKRLRYLNVRYNQLKEVPKPILQLSSLEILDISRNRLRSLPDEVRNLSSLKVLAIQRNRIERLPLCLGDMTSLRMLKLDENPLIFPPPEVWRPDANVSAIAGAEADTQVTLQIKKYLRQNNNANATRLRLQIESDSELSESSMETPRPPRPARTRFPVRPSITSLDALGIPTSISPDVPPPVPSRTHSRIVSAHNSLSIRPGLLSPPDLDAGSRNNPNDEAADDITVRPKRHGIITPRIAEQPNNMQKTPTSGPNPFNRGIESSFSSPEARLPPGSPDTSPAMAYLQEINLSLYLSMQTLSGEVQPLYDSIRWGSPGARRKTPAEFSELMTTIQKRTQEHRVRFSALQREERQIHSDPDVEKYALQQASDPLRNDALALGKLAAATKGFKLQIARQCRSKSVYRAMYHKFFEASQHLAVASKLLRHLRLYPHAVYMSAADTRPLLPAEQISPPRPTTQRPRLQLGPELTEAVTLTSPAPSVSTFSTGTWNSNDANNSYVQQMSNSRAPEPSTEDILFENILTSLYIVLNKCNDGLSKIYNHLFFERQEMEKLYGENNIQVQALGNLIKSFSELMTSITTMSKQLPMAAGPRPELRDSPDWWAAVRKPLRDWSTFLEQARSLNPSPLGGPIKTVTKTLHLAIKDASSAIANSPWTTGSTTSLPITAATSAHRKNLSGGSVPSTPLSAALGPAAQATMPAGSAPAGDRAGTVMPGVGLAGQRMTAGSRINFFERVDRFEREARQAGASGVFGYGRRS